MVVILTILAVGLNAVAFFVPTQALYLVWVALLAASILAFAGENLAAAIVWSASIVNALFLSHSVRAVLVHGWTASGYADPVVTAFCFLLPLMCLIAASRRTA